MLSTEVYYHSTSTQRGYWTFSIIELGPRGQVLDRLCTRQFLKRSDAYNQAALALAQKRSEQNAA